MSGIADLRIEERIVERLTGGPVEVSALFEGLSERDPVVLARQEGTLHALLHRLVKESVVYPVGHARDGGTIYALTTRVPSPSDPLAPPREAPAPSPRAAARLATRVARAVRDPADRGRIVADVLAHYAALAARGATSRFGGWQLAKRLLARVDGGRPILVVAENQWERVRRLVGLDGIPILTTLVVLAVVWIFVAEFRVIPTHSMEPTLRPGDRVIVKKLGGREVPDRWAVVVFHGTKDVLVKRAVGLPGDLLKIENGDLLVNEVLAVKPDEVAQAVREPVMRPGSTDDIWLPVGGTSPVLMRLGSALFADEPRYRDKDGRVEPYRTPRPLCHDVYLSTTTPGPVTLAIEFVTEDGRAANEVASVAWTRSSSGLERVTLRRGGFVPAGTEEVVREQSASGATTGTATIAVIDAVLWVDSPCIHLRSPVDAAKGRARIMVGGTSDLSVDRDVHYTSDVEAAFAVETPYRVPEGHIFLLGDHSSNSRDCRFREVGPIAIERLIGPVIFRVWPPTRIGPVR